jgi:hypothetical protein
MTVGQRDPLRVRIEQNFNAILAQNPGDLGNHVRVFFMQKLGPRLDHGYLAAEAAKHLGELDPDVAPTHDHQVLRRTIQFHDAFVVKVGNGIETFDRRQSAVGAGIDEDLGSSQLAPSSVAEGDA